MHKYSSINRLNAMTSYAIMYKQSFPEKLIPLGLLITLIFDY